MFNTAAGCVACHQPAEAGPDGLPDFLPTGLAVTKPAKSKPAHHVRAHKEVECTKCHQSAGRKTPAAPDLKGIDACRECHLAANEPMRPRGTRATCVGCHVYHRQP